MRRRQDGLPLPMAAAILIYRHPPGHCRAQRGIAASFPGKPLMSSEIRSGQFNPFGNLFHYVNPRLWRTSSRM